MFVIVHMYLFRSAVVEIHGSVARVVQAHRQVITAPILIHKRTAEAGYFIGKIHVQIKNVRQYVGELRRAGAKVNDEPIAAAVQEDFGFAQTLNPGALWPKSPGRCKIVST